VKQRANPEGRASCSLVRRAAVVGMQAKAAVGIGAYREAAALTKRQCASCHAHDAENMLRCSHCHITYYCSVACQKADWKHHKANVCVSLARQGSDRNFRMEFVASGKPPVHPCDERGILARMAHECDDLYEMGMNMPRETEVHVKLRLETCNKLVKMHQVTAGLWANKRREMRATAECTSKHRLLNELHKKQAIELMYSHKACLSFGQRERCMKIRQQVEKMLLRINKVPFDDDFDFDSEVLCFKRNNITIQQTSLLDDVYAEFQRNYHRTNRYANRRTHWKSFLFSKLDRQMLEAIYAKMAHVHDQWQNQSINGNDRHTAKDTPMNLNGCMFHMSLALEDAGSMLLHIRRTEERKAQLFTAGTHATALQAKITDMWEDYKAAAACVCPLLLDCDGCENGRCVNAGQSGDSSAGMRNFELLHSSALDYTCPWKMQAFKMEMRMAGVLRVCARISVWPSTTGDWMASLPRQSFQR